MRRHAGRPREQRQRTGPGERLRKRSSFLLKLLPHGQRGKTRIPGGQGVPGHSARRFNKMPDQMVGLGWFGNAAGQGGDYYVIVEAGRVGCWSYVGRLMRRFFPGEQMLVSRIALPHVYIIARKCS